MERQVLLIEDDEAMSAALRHGFETEGFHVDVADDGVAGLQRAAGQPDIIILDVMLPRMNGLDLCKKLRGDGNEVPIIMLTARGQEIDKVVGLKLGADDYMTKPFSFMELVARVEAVLRRTGRRGETNGCRLASCEFADVQVDFKRYQAQKAGRELELSPREFRLLEYFYAHRGEVLSRGELLDAVWDYNVIPLTRTVDTHIAKLRKKIEDCPAEPKHIITVHRVGYKLTA